MGSSGECQYGATYRLTMASVALLDLYILAQLTTCLASGAREEEATTYASVSDRFVVSFQGRVSIPLASGLQGMQPTPRCYIARRVRGLTL